MNCFPTVITVVNCFPKVITVANCFPTLITFANCFSTVITVTNCFPAVITIANCFSTFITYGQFNFKKKLKATNYFSLLTDKIFVISIAYSKFKFSDFFLENTRFWYNSSLTLTQFPPWYFDLVGTCSQNPIKSNKFDSKQN